MSRMTLLFLTLAVGIGIMTFGTKQKVATLEARLTQANHKIHAHEESMHILSAEWDFLNNPLRLQQLAQKHLGLVLGGSYHVVRLQEKKDSPQKDPYDTHAMMRLASQLGE